MSDIEPADERAISDQLRQVQQTHRNGDLETSKALLNDLFTRYGQDTVKAVRRRQDGDWLDADVALFSMFGSAGLRGNG